MTDKVMGGFNAAFGQLAARLDGKLNESLSHLRLEMEKGWKQISDPIQVDADTWLTVSPGALAVSPITMSQSGVQFAVGIGARPRVDIGKRPSIPVKPLPDVQLDAQIGNTFSVYVPVSVEYPVATRALKEMMKRDAGQLRFPPSGKYYLRVTDVDLYAYGKKAVCRLVFEGSAHGWVYLVGTPHYDLSNGVLTFPDLEYSLESRDLVVKLVDWLDHDAFVLDMRRRLVVGLAEPVRLAQSKLQNALNHRYGNVEISGSLPTLMLSSLYVDPGAGRFVAYFNASGRVMASLK